MAALIDAACDICGHIHHIVEDRLGDVVPCRECGTKFEVVEYFPPPEDETEATNNSPLPWIKGAGITVLILCVLVGLSSLLVYRPTPGSRQVAGSVWFRPRTVPQQRLDPRTDPSADPLTNRTAQQRLRRDFERLRQAQQPKLEIPATNQVSSVSATPVQTPVPQTPVPTGPPPSISGWGFDSSRERGGAFGTIRLIGTGMSRAAKVEQTFGPGLLGNARFSVVSDTEMLVNLSHQFTPRETLLLISNPGGVAVVFSEEIPTIQDRQVLPDRRQIPVCLVRNGGHVISRRGVVALLEQGGRAEIQSLTFLAVAQEGSDLHAQTVHKLYAHPQAKVKVELQNQTPLPPQPNIQFCRLPSLSPGR